jgi:hypothetical protein
MQQKNIKKIRNPFNHSFTLSAMVNYWEQHGRFNLSLYSEVIKAKMQKTNN